MTQPPLTFASTEMPATACSAVAAKEEPEDALEPTPAEVAEMRALIGQIRWRSILQYSVLAEMGASRLSTSTVRALVTLLQGPFSDRWHERLVALWALGCADLAPNHRSTVTEAVQAALIHDHSQPDLTL